MIAYKFVQVINGVRCSLLTNTGSKFSVEYSTENVTLPKIGGLFVFTNLSDVKNFKQRMQNWMSDGVVGQIELWECEVGSLTEMEAFIGFSYMDGAKHIDIMTEAFWKNPENFMPRDDDRYVSLRKDTVGKKLTDWVKLTALIEVL